MKDKKNNQFVLVFKVNFLCHKPTNRYHLFCHFRTKLTFWFLAILAEVKVCFEYLAEASGERYRYSKIIWQAKNVALQG